MAATGDGTIGGGRSIVTAVGVASLLVVAAAYAEDPPPPAPAAPKCARWDTKVAVTAIATSPDGAIVVAGGTDGSVRMLRTDGGKPETAAVSENLVSRVGVSANGRLVWVEPFRDLDPGQGKTTLEVLDAVSGARVRSIDVARNGISPKKGSPLDGSLLAVVPFIGDRALLVRLWAPRVTTAGGFENRPPEEVDLRTGAPASDFVAPPGMSVCAVSADHLLVALDSPEGVAVAQFGATTPLWAAKNDWRTTVKKDKKAGFARYDDAKFSANGAVLVAHGRENVQSELLPGDPFFETFDSGSGRSIAVIRIPKDAVAGFHVGRDFVAVVGGTTLLAYDLATGADRRLTLPSGEKFACACATHDGTGVWIGTEKGTVFRAVPAPPAAK